MAFQEIGPNLTPQELQKINANFQQAQTTIDSISGEVLNEVITQAQLVWKEPVTNFAALATSHPAAETGWTAMARDTGKVYRYNGTSWGEIQQIDAGPVNEVDSRLTKQLDDKIAKGQVSVSDIDKNKGLIDQTYLSDELKQQMAGTTPVNATPANRSITSVKMVEKSIDADILSDNILTKNATVNLADDNQKVTGGYYRASDGVFVTDASFNSSGLVPVKPGLTYAKLGSGTQITFWDANGVFVSSVTTNPFTVPNNNNIVYARFPVPIASKTMMILGSTIPTVYIPYAKAISVNDLIYGNEAMGIKRDNSFNYTIATGFYWNYLNGQSLASPSSIRTNLIAVFFGNVYKIAYGSNVVFFDENKNYISGQQFAEQDNYIKIENTNIKYIGLTSTTANSSVFKVELYFGKQDRFTVDNVKLKLDATVFGINKIASGTQLFDENKINVGGYYNYQTGQYVTAAFANSSKHILVNPDMVLEKNVAGQVAFFDINKNFVSGLNLQTVPSTFTVPIGVTYLSFSFNSSINKSTVYLKYISGEANKYTLSDKFMLNQNQEFIETIDGVKEEDKTRSDMIRGLIANSKEFLRIPTPYNDGTSWDGSNHQTTHPSVVQFATAWNGFKYWMVHTPYPYRDSSKENPCVVASNDGVVWVVPSGLSNPLDVAPTSGYNSDGHLFYNDSTSKLEMWYRTASSPVETLKRRTSSDGVNWTPVEQMIQISSNTMMLKLISPSVYYENGKYRLWVMRDWYVHLLESTDGTTWSDVGRVNSEGQDIHTWHPSIQKINGLYHMLNCDKTVNQGSTGELKYSTSTDGIAWSKERHILAYTGNDWDYDGEGIYRASMILESDSIKIYYGMINWQLGGNDLTTRWTIGLSAGKDLDSLRGIDQRTLKYYGIV